MTTRFIELAGEINESMPDYVVERATRLLNDSGVATRHARVLILGVAFKKNVADTRESAAIKVAGRLVRLGVEVSYHDPFVPEVRLAESRVQSVPLTPERLRAADLVIVTTDHDVVDYDLVVSEARLVYDTRNAIRVAAPHVHTLGAPQR